MFVQELYIATRQRLLIFLYAQIIIGLITIIGLISDHYRKHIANTVFYRKMLRFYKPC